MKLIYSVDNPHNQTMIYEHNKRKFKMRLSHVSIVCHEPSAIIIANEGDRLSSCESLDVAWESYHFGEGNPKYTENETIENNRVIDAFKKYIEAVY